ncbi:alpha-N-acetylglucosaminidase [Alteromonas lipotrueae]|uniref:alpha-N-acetylglucosaminidase n=1 Tax=Alteromonas lipotrueae TaxID=2803814 RepID=UPI001C46DDC4|nr:alpha-N-acetylglucosaminidase [Alteromonas lipotrueae]
MKKTWSSSFRIVCFSVATVLLGCETQVESTAAVAGEEQSSVQDVLKRVSNGQVPNITTRKVTDAGSDWYEVDVTDGKAEVVANSNTALAYGAYQYLRSQGALSVSWEGSRVEFPDFFPAYDGKKIETPFQQRAYLNVCAYGYTTPWWTWQRWEQEIDWMAIHGINNPVAMEGQEYVWQALWKEFGINDAQLADYFSGPAFTPWQRMGNIEGHEGPLPQRWIDKKHALQKRILARMSELDMKPVVPAFSGYVPKAFVDKHPEAKIYEMPRWTGFENATYWLDPADPLFNKVAKRFIDIYTAEYGEQQYYLSDAFNEMLPPVSEETRYADLASYGKRIYASIQQAAPNAVWVMQGWMFGADEEFWDLDSIEAFLKDVPDNKAMIHDIGNDRYHVWQRTEGFKGKPWIFGFIHNYGGSDPVYADFADYVEQLRVVTQSENAGMLTGFGVFPEGIHNNSVAYEFLFDLPWNPEPNMQAWLSTYTQARYGQSSPELMAAWEHVVEGVFSVNYWQSRWWEGSAGAYLLFKRPSIAMTQFEGHPGNLEQLDKGINQLLAIAHEYSDSPLFTYDLVDLIKQSVSLHIDSMLQEALRAYQQKQFEKGNTQLKAAELAVQNLDTLLGVHQENLHSWLSDASAYGETQEESAYYVKNARLQITQWGGPKLKDYASKAWQGMYATYYFPRWKQYLTAYRTAREDGVDFDDAAQQQALIEWESEWINDLSIPPLIEPEAPIALAKKAMNEVTQSQ